MHPQVAKLAIALENRSPILAEDGNSRRAGVAILIRRGDDDNPEIFLIKRSDYEGDPWSGQIAFPGGREEPGDADLYHTAARETHEETGLDIGTHGELLGTLDDLQPRTVRLPAVMVRPFVVIVADLPDPVLSHEVAASFWVPLRTLTDRAVWRDTTVVAGGHEMSRLAFHHEGHVVWGMTERILSDLLALIA